MWRLWCAKEGQHPALESLKKRCEQAVSGFQGDEKKKGTPNITRPNDRAENNVYLEIMRGSSERTSGSPG